MHIGESEAERLAYDGLEDLCAVWRIRAASKLTTAAVEPTFELSRPILKSKVSPVYKNRRNAVSAPRQGMFARAAQAISSLFGGLQYA